MSRNFEAFERSAREKERGKAGSGARAGALAPIGLVPRLGAEFELPVKFWLPPEVSEEYQKLRNNVLSSRVREGEPVRTIAIFSAIDREGTTTVATNLAATFAQDGRHRVLLVDANPHRACLHRIFRVRNEPGLLDVLIGSGAFPSVVRKTPAGTLGLIPIGRFVPNPSKLFELDRFQAFLEFFKSRFDVVIFDCPPMNPYAESRVLASRTDAALLVVQADVTRIAVVEKAKRHIERGSIHLLGVVLNQRRQFVPELIYKLL